MLEIDSHPPPNTINYFNGIRYGLKTQVKSILTESPEFVNILDSNGCTGVHWAAKRGDVEMLQLLFDCGGSLSLCTESESRMRPIHWAASEGKVSSISFLIKHHENINVLDANGCTPLIIATQHNHTDTVMFLLRNGADTSICDSNGDNCLHWSAYKGFPEMAGLLVYAMPRDLNAIDSFGQTPLHLASLRGNYEVVEYLIRDCGADTSIKDKSGLTALELSIKKFQLKSEWAIRKATSKSWIRLVCSLPYSKFRDTRVLTYLLWGSNEREISVWPWRLVFLSNLLGSYVTSTLTINAHLLDLTWLHIFNIITQALWWYFFLMCLLRSPSFVYDTNQSNTQDSLGRSSNTWSYDTVIKAMGIWPPEIILPAVCHTCHVVKPLRSKHCKIQRRCINKFDHFCPFVGNTLGRDNYKYFIFLLVMHSICGIMWFVSVFILWWRTTISWALFLFALYSLCWLILIASLLTYHVSLLASNLTTNEHIKSGSYSYLRNQYDLFENPFDKESPIANIIDGLFPSTKLYYSREQVIEDKRRLNTKNSLNHAVHRGGRSTDDCELLLLSEERKEAALDV